MVKDLLVDVVTTVVVLVVVSPVVMLVTAIVIVVASGGRTVYEHRISIEFHFTILRSVDGVVGTALEEVMSWNNSLPLS